MRTGRLLECYCVNGTSTYEIEPRKWLRLHGSISGKAERCSHVVLGELDLRGYGKRIHLIWGNFLAFGTGLAGTHLAMEPYLVYQLIFAFYRCSSFKKIVTFLLGLEC